MKAKKPEQVSLTDFLCSSEIAGSVYFFDLTEFVYELLVCIPNMLVHFLNCSPENPTWIFEDFV
jgi:hypothetical protein